MNTSNRAEQSGREDQTLQHDHQVDKDVTEAERQRQRATQEAQQVMDAIGINQLDHFNLLGVVANPRGSQHGGPALPTSPASALSSSHGGPTSVSSSLHSGIGGGGDGSSTTTSFLFSDTYQTLESTLSQVTEQIENLNHVFEDWSRNYLNDYYYQDMADTTPESQLQELPPELTQLDMSSLQTHLQQSGVLAQAFEQNHRQSLLKKKKLEMLQQRIARGNNDDNNHDDDHFMTPQKRSATAVTAARPGLDSSDYNTSNTAMDLSDIPEIFFQMDFDLTDPKTFRELLLSNSDEAFSDLPTPRNIDSTADNSLARNIRSQHASLEEPTSQLFQVPPPDHFTGYLDKVEVALLEQVREKSEAFFQETNRFALLKEWVGDLLLDVQRLRGLLEGQARAIQSWQQVPQWDRKRKHLVYMDRILEGSNEILRCKQCIGGLLSAKDDLGAVEQIQYARRLLAGTEDYQADESVENEDDSQISSQPQPQHRPEKEVPIELGRLQALRTVGEQLNQYESLVVTSLTEEVVEIFLEWNTSNLASMYSLSNGGIPASLKASSQQEIQRRTLSIIESLHMCKALSHMTQFYNTRLHDMVRMTVRTTVGEFASDATSKAPGQSVSVSVTAMSLERFIDCLDMLFEQILALLSSAAGVDEFCLTEGVTVMDEAKQSSNNDTTKTQTSEANCKTGLGDEGNSSDKATISKEPSAIKAIVASAGELSSKSIAELLRLRKEVHSLVSLEEMRQIWDTCMKFVDEVEKLSGHKCVALRSMLSTQAKAFVERKHDSNMTSLAAALDSERWTQCEVSAERQLALTRLCSGRAGTARRILTRTASTDDAHSTAAKSPEAEVEGIRYKVVWSCLLLMEMTTTNIEAAACFQSLASNVVGKVAELLRLFNSRATQLVLGAGAIHSAARLKSINAKHLSLVTQCLGMTIALLPHIRAALMAQLPPKQHTLLIDLDKIKKEYADHNEKVLNKFVTIIGGIVEHGLAKHIGGIDFDQRAKDAPTSETGVPSCCVFLEGVLTNTKKMHQVLSALLPTEHLQDVFSRIFAFLDQKVPELLIAASENAGSAKAGVPFHFPKSEEGKKRLLEEVASVTKSLNSLDGVFPWEFSALSVLGKTLEYELPRETEQECAQHGTPDKEGPVPLSTAAEDVTEINNEIASDKSEAGDATLDEGDNSESKVAPVGGESTKQNGDATKSASQPSEKELDDGANSPPTKNKLENLSEAIQQETNESQVTKATATSDEDRSVANVGA